MVGLVKRAQAWALGRGVLIMRDSESNRLGPQLVKLLRAMPLKVVVDVGANAGQSIDFFRGIGFGGRIVSYEPTPNLFAALEDRFRIDDRWSGHQIALGAATQTMALNVYRADVFNSFLTPSEFGKDRFATLDNGIVTAIEVPVRRLDEVWDDHVASSGALLKVDTQGFDLEVLRGAAGRLDRIDVVMTELAVNAIYEGAPTPSEVFSFMENAGFELFGLFPLSRDRSRVRLVEADCVFLRSGSFR